MFNKNGSNNGNGSANGVHKDTAPVSSTGQAIAAPERQRAQARRRNRQ